jgi:ubiquinone/menaquinone biosynthesis C-methylase UbiE
MSRPTQIEFLSRFAEAYDPVVKFMGFASLWRAMAEVAAPSRGQPALDVCTGTGGAATELARRGARVIGLDLAEGMLRRARRKHSNGNSRRPSMFVRMDARRLAFPDRSFPLVTCSMALHEMAEVERQQVLQEISRVASNRVVIGEYRVPCGRGGGLLFRAARFFEYAESDDFESFVRSNLEAQFDRAGLDVQNRWDVGAYRIWPCQVRPS